MLIWASTWEIYKFFVIKWLLETIKYSKVWVFYLWSKIHSMLFYSIEIDFNLNKGYYWLVFKFTHLSLWLIWLEKLFIQLIIFCVANTKHYHVECTGSVEEELNPIWNGASPRKKYQFWPDHSGPESMWCLFLGLLLCTYECILCQSIHFTAVMISNNFSNGLQWIKRD